MIEKAHTGVSGLALFEGDVQAIANGRFAHGLMRAEGNEHVEIPGRVRDLLMDGFEKQTDWRGARAVRNNQQDLPAGIVLRRAGSGNQLGDFIWGHALCGHGENVSWSWR